MRIQRGKYLFNYKDCWSMDMTLSPIIHAGLVKFKEELVKHPCSGYPSEMYVEDSEEGYDQWLDILSKMIYAFDMSKEPKIQDYNFTFETEWKTLGDGNSELASIDPTDKDEYNRYHRDCEEHQKNFWRVRMNLTQEYINDLFLTAHMVDRTHDHRREIAYAQKMQALYNRQNGIGKQLEIYYPVEKVSTGGYKAKSVEDAVQAMERFFGSRS